MVVPSSGTLNVADRRAGAGEAGQRVLHRSADLSVEVIEEEPARHADPQAANRHRRHVANGRKRRRSGVAGIDAAAGSEQRHEVRDRPREKASVIERRGRAEDPGRAEHTERRLESDAPAQRCRYPDASAGVAPGRRDR